jgi:hypothetical protein
MMYVSIDMDKLVFLHKHDDHEALSALSWLECGRDVSILVESTAREQFLAKMSRLDLCVLYKNTTGASLVSQESNVLREQLRVLVDATPAAPIDRDEVLAQVEAVDERIHAGERFSYARGARVPAQPQELFPLKARPLTDAQLMGAEKRAPAGLAREAELPKPPPPPAAPMRKVRAVGVRPVIWDHADKGWAAAGKPTDRTVVLALRKTWMKELDEQKNIRSATSSNELGAWMKARLG